MILNPTVFSTHLLSLHGHSGNRNLRTRTTNPHYSELTNDDYPVNPSSSEEGSNSSQISKNQSSSESESSDSDLGIADKKLNYHEKMQNNLIKNNQKKSGRSCGNCGAQDHWGKKCPHPCTE